MVDKALPTKEGFVCAGIIVGAHGIKGEVKLRLTLENEKILKKYGVPVDITGTPFSIEQWRMTDKGVLIKFANITDRNGAENMRGVALFIPSDALPPPAKEEIYYSDLKGMAVVADDGKDVGIIADVFSNGAQDIIVVINKGNEMLLPYTKDVVAEIDTSTRQLLLLPFAEQFLKIS